MHVVKKLTLILLVTSVLFPYQLFNPDISQNSFEPYSSISSENGVSNNDRNLEEYSQKQVHPSIEPYKGDKIKKWGDISHLFPDLIYNEDTNVIVKSQKVQMVINLNSSKWTEVNNTLEEFGARSITWLPASSSLVVMIPVPQTLDQQQNVNSLFTRLYEMDGVRSIRPDFIIEPDFVPNDADYSSQWGLTRIGMESAWDVSIGNSSIKVAVIDTGIDYTHPDLEDNYLPIGYDFADNDADPMDYHGHGTHVAGTIAAGIDNNIGVAGIANVSVFSQKIFGPSSGGTTSIATEAIYNATALGADIINTSWGGPDYDPALQEAINYAKQNGVLVIASAGNEGSDKPHYPASMENVIAVSAIDRYDDLASFSNYGSTIDLAAPGVSIKSTVLGGGYSFESGTSMAAPHVSGLAALLWSQYNSYSINQIESLLVSHAEDLGTTGFDIQYGWGLIDAGNAMNGLDNYDVSIELIQLSHNTESNTKRMKSVIKNYGLNEIETIDFKLYVDNILVNSTTISNLISGDSVTNYYDAYHLDNSVRNVTSSVAPLVEEIFIGNNIDTLIIKNSEITNIESDDIVKGGLVRLDLQIPDPNSWILADVYVNNELVSSISSVLNTVSTYIPVFDNGTNLISLVFKWTDGTFSKCLITINSVEVIPLLDIEIGEYIHWRYDNGGSFEDFNWTFSEWISPFKINTTLKYKDSTAEQSEIYWAIINVLNGYYEQTNFGWDSYRFSWITGIRNEKTTNDYVPGVYYWNDVQEIKRKSVTSQGYGILEAQNSHSPSQIDIFSHNGILSSYDVTYYQNSNFQNQETGYLTNSSFLPEFHDFNTNLTIPQYRLGTENSTIIEIINTGDFVESNLTYSFTVDSISYNGEVYNQNEDTIENIETYELFPSESLIIEVPLVFYNYEDHNFTVSVFWNNTRIYYNTSVISIPDNESPSFQQLPSDESYYFSDTNKQISWIFSDAHPDSYNITRNDTLVDYGEWSSGELITHEIDDLNVGIYIFKITVWDVNGNQISDTVEITIMEDLENNNNSESDKRGISFPMLYLISSLGLINTIRRSRNREQSLSLN